MAAFEGKIALVTGAGSGIGRAVALAFAAEGADVLVADIGEAGGRETVAMIERLRRRATFQRCDVADQASVEAMVYEAVDRFGRLDCAVNAAGIDPEIASTPSWDIGDYDRIMGVNLRGTMLCLKAEIAAMGRTGGGAIVNFASFAGVAGVPNKPFYTAAKHGVVGLTKAVGLDQAKHGIRVNAVCPGFVRTPMALANTEDLAGGPDAIAARNPTRRIGEPDEIAAAVLFLCSDKAGFIVGQALSIDGGISAA